MVDSSTALRDRYAGRRAFIAAAKKRYAFFVDFAKRRKDAELKELLDDVLDAVRRYVTKVLRNEAEYPALQHRYGGGDPSDRAAFQAEWQMRDAERRSAHNALIATLGVFNRYASDKYGWEADDSRKGAIPAGGLFSLDPRTISDRDAVAEWAFYLFLGLETK